MTCYFSDMPFYFTERLNGKFLSLSYDNFLNQSRDEKDDGN